jgi:hypothetical protein
VSTVPLIGFRSFGAENVAHGQWEMLVLVTRLTKMVWRAIWPHFTQAVCASAGKSKHLRLDVFASNMIKYIKDISKETASKHMQASALASAGGTNRNLSGPKFALNCVPTTL